MAIWTAPPPLRAGFTFLAVDAFAGAEQRVTNAHDDWPSWGRIVFFCPPPVAFRAFATTQLEGAFDRARVPGGCI